MSLCLLVACMLAVWVSPLSLLVAFFACGLRKLSFLVLQHVLQEQLPTGDYLSVKAKCLEHAKCCAGT